MRAMDNTTVSSTVEGLDTLGSSIPNQITLSNYFRRQGLWRDDREFKIDELTVTWDGEKYDKFHIGNSHEAFYIHTSWLRWWYFIKHEYGYECFLYEGGFGYAVVQLR